MSKAISINNISVSYSSVEAINDISFDVEKGEFVCIIGPNGGGKTTLLNTILGFLKCDTGSIKIFDKPIKESYSNISYVPQIAVMDRDFPITVIEAVMTAFLKKGLHPFKIYSKKEKAIAIKLLCLVGLEENANRLVSALSGGEFQRMLIARALASKPDIIFLDEPTANVDPHSRNIIFKLLNQLNQNGVTVVAVTHDLAEAINSATKLVCIKREMIYCGKPDMNKKISQVMYGTEIEGGF